MAATTQNNQGYPHRRYNPNIISIFATLELVLVAIILAFLFRGFLVEPFRIPTGSMASTLKGVHYHVRCTRCGYAFDLNGDTYKPIIHCPSCGFENEPEVAISNGDRILVLKSIYQFTEPKRWDVVVFKNPLQPYENYIKRLIATPGEEVEIIDGDIYINDKIAVKPVKVQRELWMPIYDNNYQPFAHEVSNTNQGSQTAQWVVPFSNESDSKWNINAKGPSVFSLDSLDGAINTVSYDSFGEGDFKAIYGYNGSYEVSSSPVCSDLMTNFHVRSTKQQGTIGAALGKYGIIYRGYVDFQGSMTIEKISDGQTEILAQCQTAPFDMADAILLSFSNVDHQLLLEFGSEKLRFNLGFFLGDVGEFDELKAPSVSIFGAGKLTLYNIAIYRDIHYISKGAYRAANGEPFKLGSDEFFVCGDNSPNSYDSRKWDSGGIGNNQIIYNMGIVPRDYLVGKAFFVYWADASRPFESLMPVVPNVSQMRFIYGSSDKKW